MKFHECDHFRLKGKFMDLDGKKVDYAALKKSKEFEEYLAEVKQLQKVKLEPMTEIQRKVFFISILFCGSSNLFF